MSENNISWFHCGRCGSLFQSPAGDVEDRSCSSCGRNPSLGIEAPVSDPAISRTPTVLPVKESHPPTGDREKHTQRRRKTSYLMPKLVFGWVVILVAILFGAQHFWHSDEEKKRPTTQAAAKEQISPEDIALLDEARPSFSQTFSGFLSANTPEERNQFVLAPITTAARMARFYGLNPILTIDPATLAPTQNAVLHLPNRRGIETQWHAADGRLLDAVFFEENGEWRLDWDHFARYSDFPWALFLAGSGDEDHGEFRLLARERLAEERKNEKTISIVLYAPRSGYANETGAQSPEFIIDRNTKNGRLLDAAFKLERAGRRPFGVRIPSINPEGMIRVRVKVRRVTENLERRFELEEVVACHWYSEDAPGVDIEEK